MEIFKQIIADGKSYYAEIKRAFDTITSPAMKITVAIVAALVLLMVFWAVLPWIGFIIAAIVIAAIIKAFLPHDTDKPL